MIDAHCHLQDSSDIGAEVQRGMAAGISTLICNGTDVESSKKAVELAEKYEGVFATVGIHPEVIQNSKLKTQNYKSKLLNLLKQPQVVAVGECGLDYTPQTTEEEKVKQRELFQFNLELAKETGLPLVVHCRNAFEEIYQRMSSARRWPGLDPIRVQMHCFTGSWDWAKKFLDLGCYLSFGGIVTFKNSHQLREVIKRGPQNQFVIETDSPYLSPEPVRNQRNCPANLVHIAKVIAQVRGITLVRLDQITSANTYRLFPKLKLPNRT